MLPGGGGSEEREVEDRGERVRRGAQKQSDKQQGEDADKAVQMRGRKNMKGRSGRETKRRVQPAKGKLIT